jgi:hypothetical protein
VIAEGERRGNAAVGTSEVVHKPSDVEVALRCLAARLRGLRGLGAAQGEYLCPALEWLTCALHTLSGQQYLLLLLRLSIELVWRRARDAVGDGDGL